MTREAWLDSHPYLRPLARCCAEVEDAVARLAIPAAPLPDWEAYRPDFHDGVPLLASAAVAIDVAPAARATVELCARLAERPLPAPLAEGVRAAHAELRADAAAPARIASLLLGECDFEPSRAAIVRWLGWTCAARRLRAVVDAFASARDEQRWMRGRCPTCGAPPSMAQLLGIESGRMRFLVCGACTTRWQYSRTGCPFCEVDTRRLAVLTIEGESGLRLDHCESCRAYLKTYDGQGDESLLLVDWTSLHLDVLAQDRGLLRRAASFFEFAVAPTAPPRAATP